MNLMVWKQSQIQNLSDLQGVLLVICTVNE